jgi:hypothetical protein
VAPALEQALSATTWQERERGLGIAAVALADRHNELGVTAPIDSTPRQFHARPSRVLGAERFADALEAQSTPEIRALPRGVGAIWQWCDATPVLEQPRLSHALASALT